MSELTAQSTAKPFLRWVGSKKKIAPLLAQKAPANFDRYVEPFMGSACLFFHLKCGEALLGDLNQELVCTMQAVRDEPIEIAARLHRLPIADKHTYLKFRAQKTSRLSKNTRAVRFIYLNRYCFNGLWRTNMKGDFNVPFAPLKTGALPSLETLVAASQKLSKAVIQCCDFGDILQKTKKGDFVYLDPPYNVSSQRIFREYGPKPFSADDLERMCNDLLALDKKGVAFLLTYADCEVAKKLLNKWNSEIIWTQRNVAGFSKHRRNSREIIVWNHHCKQI